MTFEDEANQIDADFLDLITGNLREKSKSIRRRLGINIPYASYEKQWACLVKRLGLRNAVTKILEQHMKVMTIEEQRLLHKSVRERISQQEAELPNLWCLVDNKTRRATKLGLFVLSYGTDATMTLFDKMQFHPKIVEVSRSLFETGHYAQAIFEAFKAVNNFVKEKTGRTEDGKDLMAKVFNENAPIIKLNDQLTQSDKDEQEGFRFLFMGAMVGIRNPKAHDALIQKDPHKTLEYLAFADLLMGRIDDYRTTKTRKSKINEETFITRCRNGCHEKAVDLYIKAKDLKDSRCVNGDFINWGTSGCSYRMPWKGNLSGETLFIMRCDGRLQIWSDFLRYKKVREAKSRYWVNLRNIPILATQLTRQKLPTVSIDRMENTDIESFISIIKELGVDLDKIS